MSFWSDYNCNRYDPDSHENRIVCDSEYVTEKELSDAKDLIIVTTKEYADEYTVDQAKEYAEGLQTAFENEFSERADTFENGIDTRVTTAEGVADTASTNASNAVATANTASTVADEAKEIADINNARLDTAIAGITVDNEVIDIRVGADGKTYPTAGTSVRTQLENIKDSTNKYEKNIIGIDNPYAILKWKNGYYINGSGVESQMDGFMCSDFVKVTDTVCTFTYTAGASYNTVRIVGYDTSKTFENVLLAEGSDSNKTVTKVIDTTGISYIRISIHTDHTPLSLRFGEIISPIYDTVLSKLDKTKQTNVDLSLYDEGYIETDGNIYLSGNWKHTQPMQILKSSIITFTGFTYNNVPIIVKYDEKNNVYSPLLIATASEETTITYTMETTANVIFNFTTSFNNSINVDENLDFDVLKNVVVKAVDKIENDISYTGIFHKIGVIGDSLSSGEIYNGSTVKDCYKYSWLANIARSINVEYVHYSKGGMTAKSWITNVDGYKTALDNEEVKPTAYYLALGTNDKNQSEYPIGTINDSKETNSFVGYYKNIIEHVHTVNPEAVIFCVSTYNTSSLSNPYNTIIEAIAGIYNYCFFIDYANTAEVLTTQNNDFVENSHFSTLGYIYVANAIKTLTEQIVKDNMPYFKHFGLVNDEV